MRFSVGRLSAGEAAQNSLDDLGLLQTRVCDWLSSGRGSVHGQRVPRREPWDEGGVSGDSRSAGVPPATGEVNVWEIVRTALK